jgi:Pyocin activator protein PrtN
MNTLFLLMARYNGLPVIPVDVVCRDYFQHLTPEKFLRKVLAAEISLPIVRMESSQKCAKGVPINDLAAYLDKQIEAARKECEQLKRNAA